MPLRRTFASFALVAAAAIPLTACAPPNRTLDDGTHVIVAEEVATAHMMAAVEGVLVEVDGCVGIGNVFDGGSFPVIFPAGTSVEGDTIRIPGFDQAFALGNAISGGGGYVPMSEERQADVPCPSDDVIVFNSGE